MSFTELKRTIIELLNVNTREVESALNLLSQEEKLVFQLRSKVEERIQREKPLYVCNLCGQPVVVRALRPRSSISHSFYFKHLPSSRDCPIKTDSNFTKDEIRCLKYNGAKESQEHYELKHYLAEQLTKDKRFTDIKVEQTVNGTGGWSRKWKKPDVSASFEGRRVVFEIQLSTTFLDVIVGREVFYQHEGVSIFWIFKNLQPKFSRATEKDVFFNNKSNALSIDNKSKENSIASGQLIFTGHYRKVFLDSVTGAIKECWDEISVGFDDIKFDSLTHKPYFMSFEAQYEQALAAQSEMKLQEPIKLFESLVLSQDFDSLPLRECAKKLVAIELYDRADFDYGFLRFVKTLLSVRDANVYFLNQEGKWSWVANYVWEHHKNYWLVFLFAVSEYERTDIVFKPENDKLNAKRQTFKKEWKQNEEYRQSKMYYSLFGALLPKIKGKLKIN